MKSATARLSKPRIFRRLGYEPHEIQRKVHESKARYRVLACGTRWGKTTCAAMEAIAEALQPSPEDTVRRGWIVAPSYDLADKVFRELVLIMRTRLPILVLEASELDDTYRSPMRILIANLGGGITEIRGKTADNPDSLLGEGLDFLIVDEAARLKPAIWDSFLSARLMDKGGWGLLISTPKGKGWFHDLFRRGGRSPNWESWNAPSWKNPHLKAAELEERKLHTPDRVWRQEYGAEFMEGAGQVFRNVRELATGELQDPRPDVRYIAGLDLARVGDYTVLLILDEERRVVFVDRYTRIDWAAQCGRIKSALERYNDALVLCDATGAGEPVYERLLEVGCRVEPYVFTSASKAALINNLALMLEQRDLTLPTPEACFELVDELEAFEFSLTDSGTVKTGAPPGMNDDCVIALALACWETRFASNFQVQFA